MAHRGGTKLIVLAAGFATRLYPMTLTRPKPLLHVAHPDREEGKPMIEHVLDNVACVAGIDRVYIVTNAKFAQMFEEWSSAYCTQRSHLDLTLVNDGVIEEAKRLGAIGDLGLVLRRERIEDDIIVVAGDNLFSEPLDGFGEFCRQKNAPVLGIYDVGDLEQIKKYNALTLEADGRLAFFEEKPTDPKSTLTGIALYFYPRHILPLVHEYLAEGRNPDQPGRLVQWLYPRVPFYTWRVPGLWYDIGCKETLAEANRMFGGQGQRDGRGCASDPRSVSLDRLC